MHDQFDFSFPVPPDNIGIARSWGPDENDLGVNELPTDRRHSSLHLNWHGTPARSAPLTCVNLKKAPQPVSNAAICYSPLGDATAFWSSALKCFSIYSITGCRPIFNFSPVTVLSPREINALCGQWIRQWAQQLEVIIIWSWQNGDTFLCVWERLSMLLCFEINKVLLVFSYNIFKYTFWWTFPDPAACQFRYFPNFNERLLYFPLTCMAYYLRYFFCKWHRKVLLRTLLLTSLTIRLRMPPCEIACRYTGGSIQSHNSYFMVKASQVCKVQQKHQRKWKEAMTF